MNSAVSFMRCFKADFHIHTCISPCADITMTPSVVAERLVRYGIDWIAITDHNTTRNVQAFQKALSRNGIKVMPGIEIQTVEDVHILGYFPDVETAESAGRAVEQRLPPVAIDPERDGYSLLVDETDAFKDMVTLPFGFPTSLNIEEALRLIGSFGGLPVFAHVFRGLGLFYQMGILPESAKGIPLEVYLLEKRALIPAYCGTYPTALFSSSDAHTPEALGDARMEICCESRTFSEFLKAVRAEAGRSIRLCR
mgnify:FL=1